MLENTLFTTLSYYLNLVLYNSCKEELDIQNGHHELLRRSSLLLLLPLLSLANAVSAGKLPLRSVLSTRAPARIKDEKVVIGWMLSKPSTSGCAPRMIISIDSSSEGLSRTCEARVRQPPTYSPNGSWGLYLVETRSSHFGINSRLKEYCSRNA